MRVHFICRGNVYRSRMAEAYFNSLQIAGVEVLSSGTVVEKHNKKNELIQGHTLWFLNQHGIGHFAKKHWNRLTQERIEASDITICMNQRVKDECDQMVTLPLHTFVWDITDMDEGKLIPKTYKEQEQYSKKLYREIKGKVDDLVSHNFMRK